MMTGTFPSEGIIGFDPTLCNQRSINLRRRRPAQSCKALKGLRLSGGLGGLPEGLHRFLEFIVNNVGINHRG